MKDSLYRDTASVLIKEAVSFDTMGKGTRRSALCTEVVPFIEGSFIRGSTVLRSPQLDVYTRICSLFGGEGEGAVLSTC